MNKPILYSLWEHGYFLPPWVVGTSLINTERKFECGGIIKCLKIYEFLQALKCL